MDTSVIQRQHLDQHVRVKCPLTVVQCKLHHAGCEVTRPRKDVADHMKEDSISHISLLAAENYRLCKDLLEKEEQIVLLTQKNSELEEKTNNHYKVLLKPSKSSLMAHKSFRKRLLHSRWSLLDWRLNSKKLIDRPSTDSRSNNNVTCNS